MNISNARGCHPVEGELNAVRFPGPSGPIEGLWKEASGRRAGSAVFAHPHPLHGGSLHNKVVYRAARTLCRAGYGTLRFNFRGVGASAGRYDEGRGEIADFRAAQGEAERRAGLPQVAGGFSFGSAVALRAIVGDSRVAAYIGAGLPVASESRKAGKDGLPLPEVPALFLVGERDTFGPPELLRRFVGDAGRIVVVPDADHFFAGKLTMVEEAIAAFLAELRAAVATS